MNGKNGKKPDSRGRHYFIDLNRWRSKTALLAGSVTLVTTILAIVNGVIGYVKEGLRPIELYRFFTPNANTLTALAAAFIIPYAVEGIRKKRFTYPKWVAMLHYSGTICTTLTMIFSLCFISFYDPYAAFGGNNFYLHFICPILILVCFFLVESDNYYTLRDSFLCVIPFSCYVAVYFWRVVLVGAKNGGWPDLYHLTEFVSVYFSLPMIMVLACAISLAIRWYSNRKTAEHKKKMTALWTGDVDPVEIRIEVYGLGRYMGLSGEENDIHLPLDILKMLAEQYSLKPGELLQAYGKGVLDGLAQKEKSRSEGKTV